MLRAEALPDAAAFFEHAGPFLEQHGVRFGLKLGIAHLLKQRPEACPDARFVVLRRGAAVCGCALQTPPRSLLISDLDDAAVEVLCAALSGWGHSIPAVHGPSGSAWRFAERWASRYGYVSRMQLGLRLFSLAQVTPPRPTRGFMRAARPRDEGLVVRWYRDFHREAVPHDRVDPVAVAQAALNAANVFVWDAGEPVCMAAVGRELQGSISIGPVYTPREQRGRGYASALVAALSQRALDAGKRQVCLYTDVENAVTNRIYPRIGYVPVDEFAEFAFESPRG
jgi:GNAT superfamily N-acetyltransferase